MSDFMQFKTAVREQFNRMAAHKLFKVAHNKDDLWELYLESFPKGSNEIFRERTEHDCQCCKQFIRNAGQIVTYIDGHKNTIWDITIGGSYQIVANAMAEAVRSSEIADIFLHDTASIGTDHNHENAKPIIRWEHFQIDVPAACHVPGKKIPTLLGKAHSDYDVCRRGLLELNLDSVETVIELIEQNSLYRGEEHLQVLQRFHQLKTDFQLLSSTAHEEFFWKYSEYPIRNSVIGTLLVDLSDGMDLNKAVYRFEAKVAPANYKRSKSVVTKGMIQKAKKKVEELGIGDSLQRRYAHLDDITINNILFANRDTKVSMDVFDEMEKTTTVTPQTFAKAEEISIDTFVRDILPKAHSVELLLENTHSNNLVSLIAPENKDAPNILKWANNFSWSYNGEVTDSIKDRVAKAGGNVNAILRCSLSWFNYDDLDIHIIEPSGEHIYYGNKQSRTGGILDVDMNAGGRSSREAVENTVWLSKNKMMEGDYKVFVNNYQLRETTNIGFDFEIEFENTTYNSHYPKAVGDGENINVAKFNYSKKNGIVFGDSLLSTQATKEIWGIHTQNFQEVSVVMHSPNHWDGHKTGNKHWFFMLKDCSNPDESRGLYNEFLSDAVHEHRKVFEVLGSKMKVPKAAEQLSGLGFSSTQRNQVICRVSGSFNRVVKINF